MYRKLLRILLIVIAFAVSTPAAFATHQRAGEISYVYISGLTYEFTIVTYTYTPSPADRPQIEVFWGDGSSSVIDRTSKVNLENNISRNVYVTQHTFAAAGTYHVTFEDPNRNAGIVNIPSSVEIPFFIETILVINPFIGGLFTAAVKPAVGQRLHPCAVLPQSGCLRPRGRQSVVQSHQLPRLRR